MRKVNIFSANKQTGRFHNSPKTPISLTTFILSGNAQPENNTDESYTKTKSSGRKIPTRTGYLRYMSSD